MSSSTGSVDASARTSTEPTARTAGSGAGGFCLENRMTVGPSWTSTASRKARPSSSGSRGAVSRSPGTSPVIDMSHMPLCEAPSVPVIPARSSTKVTPARCSAQSMSSWSKARLRNVAYTQTTGCIPPNASPDAIVTACCSAIPTSNTRSGCRSANSLSPWG